MSPRILYLCDKMTRDRMHRNQPRAIAIMQLMAGEIKWFLATIPFCVKCCVFSGCGVACERMAIDGLDQGCRVPGKGPCYQLIGVRSMMCDVQSCKITTLLLGTMIAGV
jgi:hypothetical protein